MKTLYLTLIFLLVSTVSAQDSAKELFFRNTATGESAQVPKPQAKEKSPKSKTTDSHANNKSEVTGLMYWIEMISNQGESLRVNSNHIFHSGDRVRIHLAGNIDGRLSVFQSQDMGPLAALFPSQGKTGVVSKYVEEVLPSKNGWFRFDNNPGVIRLIVKIQANPSASTPDTTPLKPTDQETLLFVENDLNAQAKKFSGSKALVVEEDSTKDENATYTVVDSRREKDVPPGIVMLELRLVHRE
jgi:hypothetical protein